MSTTRPVPPAAVDALRRTVDGLVVYPTDAAYRSLRAEHLRGAPRPDVVVVPSSEAGVCAAVVAARVHGLQLAGRHPDGRPVVLVLTHRLADVVVDVGARTAAVGPGATWASVVARVGDSGLSLGPAPQPRHDPRAPVLDSVSAGLTAVVSARVVRADGFVHVTDDALPPAGGPETWIVTAALLRLGRPTPRLLDASASATARTSAPSSS